jgi:histidyl-tRNA synthetase
MYEFKDLKGRSLTLRPEETAPVVRAGLENNLIASDRITKFYYLGPMFRYERPQAGRQRQFHQAGIEVFGSADPLIDAEVIMLNVQLFKELGLKGLAVNLNSVGCAKCRPDYRKKLQAYFKANVSNMCADCQKRFETNPLRILDCKEAKCQKYIDEAPGSVETLCAECKTHFNEVIKLLDFQAVKFEVNKRLVRGLDYYTKTTFEIVSSSLGAQNAVSGGGRYDNLVEELGGKPTPAVGFAIGLERVIQIMSNALHRSASARGDQCQMSNEGKIIMFIAALGDEARKLGFDLTMKLRAEGMAADLDYTGRALKAQLKLADKLAAKYVYIIGEDELKKGYGILKNMASGDQKEIEFAKLGEALK